ncbi:MAG: ECF-type sigma factor [Gemmataceae bacterium]|nr:ECF-type sigma factor [Gemmataceae bacterium]
MSSGAVTPTQHCLDQLRAGDPSAREELLRVSRERLLLLIRQMMNRYARLRRWEESDNVLQNVLIRLNRSLAEVSLDSPSDFLRLAAVQIRRELTDLARHYFGPEGLAAHHATPGPISPECSAAGGDAPDLTNDPASLMLGQKAEARECMGQLRGALRERERRRAGWAGDEDVQASIRQAEALVQGTPP